MNGDARDARNLGRGYVRLKIEPLLAEYYAENPDKVKDLVDALLS